MVIYNCGREEGVSIGGSPPARSGFRAPGQEGTGELRNRGCRAAVRTGLSFEVDGRLTAIIGGELFAALVGPFFFVCLSFSSDFFGNVGVNEEFLYKFFKNFLINLNFNLF